MKDIGWHEGIKYIFVIPLFLVSYWILSEPGGVVVTSLLQSFTNDRTVKFFVLHTYYDFICILIPIYFSCLAVPYGKAIVAAIYACLVVFVSGVYVETFGLRLTFGNEDWKKMFIWVVFLVAGILPFLIFLAEAIAKKYKRSSSC